MIQDPTPLATKASAHDAPTQPARRSGIRRFPLRYLILGITCFALILNYADRAALGIAGSDMMREYGFSKTQFGFIASIFFLGYAPFAFLGGWLSDKYGPRLIMGAAVAWWSLFTGLTAAGTSYVSLLVIRFLFGFGEGPQGSVTVKTMRNWFPQKQMGTSVGISQGFTPLGGAIGTPIVAWLIASYGNWRVPFVVFGVLGVLMAIGWWVVVRDTPAVHPLSYQEDIDDVVEGAIVSEHAVSNLDEEVVAPLGFYLRQPLVLSTGVSFFAYAWVLYTFLTWFPIYLVQERGVNLKEVASVGALPWILGIVGYMGGGILTDVIGRRTGKPAAARKGMIVFGLLGTALLMACLGLVTTVSSAVAMMSGVVFLLYLTGSQYFLVISDSIPGKRLGAVVGFVHFMANTAGILAPVLVGFIVDRTHSWALTFGVCSAICVAGVVALLIWGRTAFIKPA